MKPQFGLKYLLATFIKICSMNKLIHQNILFSNTFAASLWHHVVIVKQMSKLSKLSSVNKQDIPQFWSKIPEWFETEFKGVEFWLDRSAWVTNIVIIGFHCKQVVQEY